MADAFVGMTVSVKLKPGAARPSIMGKVVNIHDQTLTLEHVRFPDTGDYLPIYSCPSYQISDLEVVDSNIYQPTFPSGASTIPLRVAPVTYSDPAILSYDRPTSELPHSATPVILGSPAVPTPIKELPAEVGDDGISAVPVSAIDFSSPRFSDSQKPPKKGKGWRSTPLLEETNEPFQDTPPQQPKQVNKPKKQKKPSKRNQAYTVSQNGWATEDATDVQDLGDFDFEANLSKFDKTAVFNQIRIEDNTADEDRLVSHNRARPGTYGGKNLHPTEMVLSPQLEPLTGDDVDGFSDEQPLAAGGRTSRQSTRTRDTRNQQNNGHEDSGRSVSRALRSVPSGAHPLNASIISSTSFNRSTSSLREKQAHFSPSQPTLRITSSMYPCPSVEPERLRQVEQEYTRRGLSMENLVEITARSIAQVMSKATAAAPAPLRRNSKSTAAHSQPRHSGPRPVIVVLAGNHRKGAKAIAAVRHLYSRGFKFLLSLTDFSNPASWQPWYRTQVQLLQSLGRKMNARIDSWPGISAQIKKLSSPPALIIDALLDGETYGAIEDVHSAVQVREVIDWTNRSRAAVFSLECPSGYDASTGETTVMEGEPVAVKPDRVLSLGAVVSGVAEALAEGERWTVSMLDVGLMSSMQGEEMVRFESDWVVDVEFSTGD